MTCQAVLGWLVDCELFSMGAGFWQVSCFKWAPHTHGFTALFSHGLNVSEVSQAACERWASRTLVSCKLWKGMCCKYGGSWNNCLKGNLSGNIWWCYSLLAVSRLPPLKQESPWPRTGMFLWSMSGNCSYSCFCWISLVGLETSHLLLYLALIHMWELVSLWKVFSIALLKEKCFICCTDMFFMHLISCVNFGMQECAGANADSWVCTWSCTKCACAEGSLDLGWFCWQLRR